MAQTGRLKVGRACPLCPGISDINLFRYCQGVIDLDAEIPDRCVLCLSQIKSEHIGDAARPGPDGKECAQLSEQGAMSVHPCPTISASAPHCNNSCTTAVRDGDVARRKRQRGQGIPVGSNRSAFQHMRFAMGSAAMSVDRECPLIEVFG